VRKTFIRPGAAAPGRSNQPEALQLFAGLSFCFGLRRPMSIMERAMDWKE
jgi:hypothetical protein